MPNFLIVDDSESERRLVVGMLENQPDFRVAYAGDGKAALAHFESALPDIVLTALHMPEMDGLELVTAIKADFPMIPVILMTAWGSEDIAAEALRRGAASYVPKKKLADVLVETITRVLSAASEDRTHSRLMHHLAECHAKFEL